jgi:hypothetical protein
MTTNHTTASKVIKFLLIAIGLTVFSWGCGALAGFSLPRLFGDGSLADLGLAIIGLLGGYLFGIIAGMLAIRFIFRQKGSLLLSIAATIIFIIIAVLLSIPLNWSNNPDSVIVIILFLGVPFAALGGFYWKRKRQVEIVKS